MEHAVGMLAALDALARPAIRVGDEWVPVRVLAKRHTDREVFVAARERDGDRLLRVRTEWAGGWLDPVVDVAERSAADPAFEPAGRLGAVRSADWACRSGVATTPAIKG